MRCIFDPQSELISWWDSFLVLGMIYSTAFTPLAIVFHQARWSGYEAADAILDTMFVLDMLVRFRTASDQNMNTASQPTENTIEKI